MWESQPATTPQFHIPVALLTAIKALLILTSLVLAYLATWTSLIDAEPETTFVLLSSIGTIFWTSHRRTIQNKVNYIMSQVLPSSLGFGPKDREDQALVALHGILECRRPLPPMGGYRMTSQSALVLASIVMRHKPQVVVELGSGLSSLILGYCGEKQACDVVLSFEHEEVFAEQSRALLREHRLEDRVAVRTAPLREWNQNGKSWQWYSPEAFAEIERIDLLFVDGPPGRLQSHSRYPAVPAFARAFRPGTLIILDDVNRGQEMAIVKQWLREFDLEVVKILHADKGMAVLRVR